MLCALCYEDAEFNQERRALGVGVLMRWVKENSWSSQHRFAVSSGRIAAIAAQGGRKIPGI